MSPAYRAGGAGDKARFGSPTKTDLNRLQPRANPPSFAVDRRYPAANWLHDPANCSRGRETVPAPDPKAIEMLEDAPRPSKPYGMSAP
jgi:hypothetical protein